MIVITSTLPITRSQAYYKVNVLDNNNPIDMRTTDNFFGASNASLPSNQDVIFDFCPPKIRMTQNDADSTCGNIVPMSFNWRFTYDPNNVPADKTGPITFDIETEGIKPKNIITNDKYLL